MPGLIAALATFLAVPASILGNEGAHRWGRAALAAERDAPVLRPGARRRLLGEPVPSRWLMPLILVYAASMNLDSAALTAGVLTETPPENAARRSRCTLR
jgi:hypothetical protein